MICQRLLQWCLGLCLLWLTGCETNKAPTLGSADLTKTLDAWHEAAAKADREGYIGRMMPDGVFMGTDATERWSTSAFDSFVTPYFKQGKGWRYIPQDRNIVIAQGGHVAWFDERLMNEKYGELRGTGVAVLYHKKWRIAHYSMSLPVPNDLTARVVALITSAK